MNISEGTVASSEKIPWYRWNDFSLLPTLTTRKADKYNNFSWQFSWLCFHFWSLDQFTCEFNFGLQHHWRGIVHLYIGAILPYLRVYIALPIPLLGYVFNKLQRQTQQIEEMS